MKPTALLELLHANPFRPFRIHMTDGNRHEVLRADLAVVTTSVFLLGRPAADGPPGLAETFSMLSLSHIKRLELIEPTSASPS